MHSLIQVWICHSRNPVLNLCAMEMIQDNFNKGNKLNERYVSFISVSPSKFSQSSVTKRKYVTQNSSLALYTNKSIPTWCYTKIAITSEQEIWRTKDRSKIFTQVASPEALHIHHVPMINKEVHLNKAK